MALLLGKVSVPKTAIPAAPPANGAPVAAPAPAPVAPEPVKGTPVSELLGTTVPFNALEAAVAKGMVDSLAVCLAA